jgi:hypothetical protein
VPLYLLGKTVASSGELQGRRPTTGARSDAAGKGGGRRLFPDAQTRSPWPPRPQPLSCFGRLGSPRPQLPLQGGGQRSASSMTERGEEEGGGWCPTRRGRVGGGRCLVPSARRGGRDADQRVKRVRAPGATP